MEAKGMNGLNRLDRQSCKTFTGISPSVLVLIVTYQPGEIIAETFSNLRSASPQPLETLVIDNASNDDRLPLLRSYVEDNVQILRMSSNKGLASAFNLGVHEAWRRGRQWIFILDQDSQCHPGALSKLISIGERLQEAGESVGGVCSTVRSKQFSEAVHVPYRWTGRKLEPLLWPLQEEMAAVDSCISSGTLYSVDALKDVGGFREDFFIDFVDHECHLRLRKKGWLLLWSRDAVLSHSLGKVQKMTAHGLFIEHEPFRYYYMSRNMMRGLLEFGGWPAVWSFTRELYSHVLLLKRYGQHPGRCLHYILKGLVHALAGKSGPLDARR